MVKSVIRHTIMAECKEDYDQITEINNLAFNQLNEGVLISKLRGTNKYISELSLVAEFQNELIGHILFYPLDIISKKKI
jgi:putative acetyltransferase